MHYSVRERQLYAFLIIKYQALILLEKFEHEVGTLFLAVGDAFGKML
jgi:hypothetical protein